MSERTEVQDPLLHYATEIGWTSSAQDGALPRRGGETGLFFNFNVPNHGNLFKRLLSAFVPESEQFTDLSRP